MTALKPRSGACNRDQEEERYAKYNLKHGLIETRNNSRTAICAMTMRIGMDVGWWSMPAELVRRPITMSKIN